MSLLDSVTKEMVRMLARQLDSAPTADELPYTAQVMADDLAHTGLTDADAHRVTMAFIKLGPQIQWWPTSRMVIECLPAKATPKKLSPPARSHENVLEKLANMLAAKKDKTALRSVFLPGESLNDFLAKAHKSRKSREQLEAERLVENGWDSEKEKSFRDRARTCHMVIAPYPTDEDIQSAEEAAAEREAILNA